MLNTTKFRNVRTSKSPSRRNYKRKESLRTRDLDKKSPVRSPVSRNNGREQSRPRISPSRYDKKTKSPIHIRSQTISRDRKVSRSSLFHSRKDRKSGSSDRVNNNGRELSKSREKSRRSSSPHHSSHRSLVRGQADSYRPNYQSQRSRYDSYRPKKVAKSSDRQNLRTESRSSTLIRPETSNIVNFSPIHENAAIERPRPYKPIYDPKKELRDRKDAFYYEYDEYLNGNSRLKTSLLNITNARQDMIDHIIQSCLRLQLPMNCMAATLIFYQRFHAKLERDKKAFPELYAHQVEHDNDLMIAACMLFAGKVTNCRIGVTNAIKGSWRPRPSETRCPNEESFAFLDRKESVIHYENCLITAVGLDLAKDTPYAVVNKIISPILEKSVGTYTLDAIWKKFTRQTYEQILESLRRTIIAVTYNASEIATAAAAIASFQVGIPLPGGLFKVIF
ncbi:4664_t:CDS:2 [Scutellospora calospora]|uniref:4664_t:CDS:1 n=1 Tax=Scutellospora calospora TaxID=85575 RepID=A0ACA9L4B5_9GLOM|nr:4664_t:CDS:2 [Scutellospora calospora]